MKKQNWNKESIKITTCCAHAHIKPADCLNHLKALQYNVTLRDVCRVYRLVNGTSEWVPGYNPREGKPEQTQGEHNYSASSQDLW